MAGFVCPIIPHSGTDWDCHAQYIAFKSGPRCTKCSQIRLHMKAPFKVQFVTQSLIMLEEQVGESYVWKYRINHGKVGKSFTTPELIPAHIKCPCHWLSRYTEWRKLKRCNNSASCIGNKVTLLVKAMIREKYGKRQAKTLYYKKIVTTKVNIFTLWWRVKCGEYVSCRCVTKNVTIWCCGVIRTLDISQHKYWLSRRQFLPASCCLALRFLWWPLG